MKYIRLHFQHIIYQRFICLSCTEQLDFYRALEISLQHLVEYQTMY